MSVSKKSPVVEAWEAYQREAALDPFSEATKKARSLYTRRLKASRKSKA